MAARGPSGTMLCMSLRRITPHGLAGSPGGHRMHRRIAGHERRLQVVLQQLRAHRTTRSAGGRQNTALSRVISPSETKLGAVRHRLHGR